MQRPILFSGPMIRAILDGRKTQTRRVLKPQPEWSEGGVIRDAAGGQMDYIEPHWSVQPKPAYAVGDVLWVREAHALVGNVDPPWVLYRANGYEAECERLGFCNFPPEPEVKWRPSIHMPRWASRITLRVTAVKVERLQDISEADCYAEGCEQDDADGIPVWYVRGTGLLPHPNTGPKCYRLLWESINGPGSWDANPWVVAYSFERVLPK